MRTSKERSAETIDAVAQQGKLTVKSLKHLVDHFNYRLQTWPSKHQSNFAQQLQDRFLIQARLKRFAQQRSI